QVVHDEEVVKSLRQTAIHTMASRGVTMTLAEEKEALKLFPAVSGLAHHVHDNDAIRWKFQDLIEAATDLETNKKALD
ncbi:hypothetical protein CPB84DRAFT_1690769, partial [Gymnopilus junonius]